MNRTYAGQVETKIFFLQGQALETAWVPFGYRNDIVRKF